MTILVIAAPVAPYTGTIKAFNERLATMPTSEIMKIWRFFDRYNKYPSKAL